ncbi:MAG: hypothetical protein MZU97_01045 [Bacillus subtilis]|nr:hypothetical protein [Bacillus subtilis]
MTIEIKTVAIRDPLDRQQRVRIIETGIHHPGNTRFHQRVEKSVVRAGLDQITRQRGNKPQAKIKQYNQQQDEQSRPFVLHQTDKRFFHALHIFKIPLKFVAFLHYNTKGARKSSSRPTISTKLAWFELILDGVVNVADLCQSRFEKTLRNALVFGESVKRVKPRVRVVSD